MSRTTTGRCWTCEVRYEWPRKGSSRLLARAWCPECGAKLRQTTRSAQIPVVEEVPTIAYTHSEAKRKAADPGLARKRGLGGGS